MSPQRQSRINEALGIEPNAAALVAAYWYRPAGAGGGTTLIPAEGIMSAQPIQVGRDCLLDRLAVEVTVIGTAGAVVRLGIYKDNRGLPGALLLDGGTIDATTTGNKSVTISQFVRRGLIWVASVVQGAAGTRPTMRVNNASNAVLIGDPAATPGTPGVTAGYAQTATVSGALPSTFTVNNFAGAPMMMWVRAV